VRVGQRSGELPEFDGERLDAARLLTRPSIAADCTAPAEPIFASGKSPPSLHHASASAEAKFEAAAHWTSPTQAAAEAEHLQWRFAMGDNFAWYQLSTSDIDGAKAFYNFVVGWEATAFPGNPDYHVLTAAGKGVGGLRPLPDGART